MKIFMSYMIGFSFESSSRSQILINYPGIKETSTFDFIAKLE